jgi:hypothetical protein
LLRRALSNLLGNATRYATPGSCIEIQISTPQAGQVTLAVQNQGQAIAAEHLPRLFDRFYRSDAARSQADRNHGLGLSIVAAIARMHGGQAFAHSDLSVTSIGLSLPADQDQPRRLFHPATGRKCRGCPQAAPRGDDMELRVRPQDGRPCIAERKHHALLEKRCLPGLAASAALGLPALAQGRIPDMQQAGALRYSCGGIGEDESTLMRAAMKDYPLSLLFAQKDGAYLANVAVEVSSGKDSSRFTANGPVCLIQLPAGSYKITATTREAQPDPGGRDRQGPASAGLPLLAASRRQAAAMPRAVQGRAVALLRARQ